MKTKTKQRFAFRKACGYFSIFGFITSLVFHLTSILGFSLFGAFVGFLHIGALLAFGLMLIFVLNVPGGEIWKREFVTERLKSVIPKKLSFVVLSFFIYMILNSIWISIIRPNGLPSFRDEKYVILSEGRINTQQVIREITKEEYDLLNAKDIRDLTGYWMFFYLIPALYFWFSLKKQVLDV
jgi:hypothetical protein